MNSEFYSLTLIFLSAKLWSFCFSLALKLIYQCAVVSLGRTGTCMWRPCHTHKPVEALWSPGHGSTPSPRQVTPPALPNLEVSPPQLGRCCSSQAVFCKDWRCPRSPRISSDSLLPGLHSGFRSRWPAGSSVSSLHPVFGFSCSSIFKMIYG